LPMLVMLWLSISLPIPSQIVLAAGIAMSLVHLPISFRLSLFSISLIHFSLSFRLILIEFSRA
jgi:hypothetical protein